MANIVTREVGATAKGSPLTNQELDNNFINLNEEIATKQAQLVSGTDIKTVNSESLLGSGNVAVQLPLVSGTNIKTVNNTSLLGSGNVAVQLPLVSGTNIKTLNGTSVLGPGNLEIGGGISTVLDYENRGTLRALSASDDDVALVSGLGLFVFRLGSDEPDDDESCFATATGCWLLEAVHWDVVDAWQLEESFEERFQAFDTRVLHGTAAFDTRVLHGTATCAIITVGGMSSASFTGTVAGASVGDRVLATPPAQLGSTATDTSRLSYYAWVSAANTVTIVLNNASSGQAITNTSVRTAWPITVIKEI